MININYSNDENYSYTSPNDKAKIKYKHSLNQVNSSENINPVNAKKLWKILAGNVIQNDLMPSDNINSQAYYPTKSNFFMRNMVSFSNQSSLCNIKLAPLTKRQSMEIYSLKKKNGNSQLQFDPSTIGYHSRRQSFLFPKETLKNRSFDEDLKSRKFFNEKDIQKYIRSSTCHCKHCGQNSRKFIFSNYVAQINEGERCY